MTEPDRLSHADVLMREHAWQLLDSAGAIVLVLGPDGRIDSCNNAMEKLGGYPCAELRGRDWFAQFIPEDQHQTIRAVFTAVLGGEPVTGFVNEVVTRAGARRSVEWYAKVVQDTDGQSVGVICVGLDVTDKLEMHAKLVQSERLAAIGMIAAMFAHEVGNPLNSMYLQAQLLRRRIDSPNPESPLGPKVDAMIHEIQRLNSLLEDFRSFQRPDRVLFEPTDVGAVLSHVRELIGPRAEVGAIELKADIALELPRIRGNANKLEQVFINLCKNAIEAMPDGGTLRLVSRRVGDSVQVDVCDTGTGIPPGLDVFEPFATSKPAGMGLGLALVRELVHLHQGEIRYVSSTQGTTFTIDLPIPNQP